MLSSAPIDLRARARATPRRTYCPSKGASTGALGSPCYPLPMAQIDNPRGNPLPVLPHHLIGRSPADAPPAPCARSGELYLEGQDELLAIPSPEDPEAVADTAEVRAQRVKDAHVPASGQGWVYASDLLTKQVETL